MYALKSVVFNGWFIERMSHGANWLFRESRLNLAWVKCVQPGWAACFSRFIAKLEYWKWLVD